MKSESAGLARMERYLAGLPAGLDAFPECVAKGSVLRSTLVQQPVAEIAARLPAALRALVVDPPVDSEWMSEVRFVAIYLGVADVRGLADDEVLAWSRDRNRALFRNPAYRILMAVSSPATLLRGATMRWSNWHRGSTLEIEGITDAGVRALLRFPPGLFDGLMLKVFGEAFSAALELARAPSPRSAVELVEPGVARYLVTWGA
ncbi:MAG TPA: hypothetical protein VLT47_06715 [Anaeromyxobacteraceae bacterium]|nr:hypothetical protein [Anaeromyxobacteraceae bacterium]